MLPTQELHQEEDDDTKQNENLEQENENIDEYNCFKCCCMRGCVGEEKQKICCTPRCCPTCCLSCNRYCTSFGRSPCGILTSFIAISILLSAFSCLYIGLNYVPYLIMNSSASNTTDPQYNNTSTNMGAVAGLGVVTLYLLVRIYGTFLSTYISFVFNYKMVQKYDLKSKIEKSWILVFCLSFLGWLAMLITWTVYLTMDLIDLVDDDYDDTDFDTELTDFMNDKVQELTSVKSPLYWGVSLILAPTYLLFAIFFVIFICKPKFVESDAMAWYSRSGIGAARRSGGSELLLNPNNQENERRIARKNQKFFYRIIGIHALLFLTWIVWKWITTPFVGIQGNDITNIDRNNVFASYWVLYIFTTIIKYICYKLCDVKDDDGDEVLLFDGKKMKIIINIMISILFSFGLKFVFTNVGNWVEFLIIHVMNSVMNIFMNGSLQSHQYGKQLINGIKLRLNKSIVPQSKQLTITDFSQIEEVLKYNKQLAFGLSIKFLISSCSSIIMIVYFAMSMVSFNMDISDQVYEFMAASFGFECIVFFGQIYFFKKRDRKYFLSEIYKQWRDEWSKPKKIVNKKNKNAPAKIVIPKSSWIEFMSLALLLAWFWIGNLTGCPADFQK